MRRKRIQLLVAIIPAAVLSCTVEPPRDESTQAASVLAPAIVTVPGAFYPLSTGNSWEYRHEFSFQVIPDVGPADPPEVIDEILERRQMETLENGDNAYVVEREYLDNSVVATRLYRQDRSGLYERDGSPADGTKRIDRPSGLAHWKSIAAEVAERSNLDPASVARHLQRHAELMTLVVGVSPGELLRLAYPLHPGAEWIVLDSPLVVSTVEGVDRIAGSPAYRIRIDAEFLGSNDVAHVWYGRCGFVGLRAHLEGDATDEQGNRIGRFVSDETWDVLDIDVDGGGCAVRPEGGGRGGADNSQPIAVGNRWTYEIRTTEHIGSDRPNESTTIADDEQVEWVDIDGRTYMKQVMTPRGTTPWIVVQYVRQDHDGLYRLDPPGTAARAGAKPSLSSSGLLAAVRAVSSRALAGPEGGEAVTLEYPLRTGGSWTMRDSGILGTWTASVEGKERLSLPAGEFDSHRIRIARSFDAVGDELLVWYGREGLLRVFAHTQMLDGFVEEEWVLQSVELVR